jgi:hypothetical protein
MLSSDHPVLSEAVETFPRPILREWLRIRWKAADVIFPKWRDVVDKRRRISILDISVRLAAALN